MKNYIIVCALFIAVVAHSCKEDVQPCERVNFEYIDGRCQCIGLIIEGGCLTKESFVDRHYHYIQFDSLPDPFSKYFDEEMVFEETCIKFGCFNLRKVGGTNDDYFKRLSGHTELNGDSLHWEWILREGIYYDYDVASTIRDTVNGVEVFFPVTGKVITEGSDVRVRITLNMATKDRKILKSVTSRISGF